MRPLFVRLTPFLALIAVASCGDEITGIPPGLAGTYSVNATDSLGRPAFSGDMTLEVRDTMITGSSTFWCTQCRLFGVVHDDTLVIGENTVDISLRLVGTFSMTKIAGTWTQFFNSAQRSNGAFVAHRKAAL